MKVAFAGTPEFAATVLRGLIFSDHEVGLVISQPDARRGRGRRKTTTPVAELALTTGIPLIQPDHIGEADRKISHHDALVVAAYGQILHTDTLQAAPYGAWNVHASLLPAYRGAAPVERAVMAGEQETGVSIMRMEEGLDTGPVALQKKVPLSADTRGGDLTLRLAGLGAKAIVEVLCSIETDTLTLKEQDNTRATYAPKLSVEDRVIRWGRSAEEVHRQIMALSPHIGARTYHPEVEGPIKILRTQIFSEPGDSPGPGEIYAANGRIVVGCAPGKLEVIELQFPGSNPLKTREFLKGNTLDSRFIL